MFNIYDMKKFNAFIKENYHMGKMDIIVRIMELSDEYDQSELEMMEDSDLDELSAQLEDEEDVKKNLMIE